MKNPWATVIELTSTHHLGSLVAGGILLALGVVVVLVGVVVT